MSRTNHALSQDNEHRGFEGLRHPLTPAGNLGAADDLPDGFPSTSTLFGLRGTSHDARSQDNEHRGSEELQHALMPAGHLGGADGFASTSTLFRLGGTSEAGQWGDSHINGMSILFPCASIMISSVSSQIQQLGSRKYQWMVHSTTAPNKVTISRVSKMCTLEPR